MGKFLDQQGSQQRTMAGPPRKPSLQQSVLNPGSSVSPTGFNFPLVRKYGQSEYKDLASAEALTEGVRDLKRQVSEDTEKPFFEKAQFLGGDLFNWGPLRGITEKGQDFAMTKKDVGERILRLRSGAQINEREYKRFMDLLPTLFRGDKLDIKQLERFENEFEGIKGRIQQGSLWNPQTKNFDINEDDIQTTMKENNMTREQVLKALGG